MNRAIAKLRLGDITRFVSGGTPSKQVPRYWGGSTPWVSAKDLKSLHIDSSIDTLSDSGRDAASLVPRGTLLILVRGMTLFKSIPIGIASRELAINQYLKGLITNGAVSPEFLAYSLLAKEGELLQMVEAAGHGTGRLDTDALKDVLIRVPSLSEQHQISSAIATWDTAIQKTEQLIAAKERHYSHELSRLISRGQHPHGHVGTFAEEVSTRNRGGTWRTVALSDIATIWKGQQLNKDAMVEDGTYYALNGGIKPSGRTTEWNCEADTVTVSSGGNSCGFINFNRERFWCGGDCFALKNLSADTEVAYLFHYLKGQQHRMMDLRTGSGIPHVYRADLEAFPVVLPDLATQTAIARYLNALREEIDLLGQSVAALKTQKRGLMQKLLIGQWRLPLPLPQHINKETVEC
jgi:type I restriction enzyme, S subunit